MLEETKEVFRKWYHIPDEQYIELLLSFRVAHTLPGNPVWLFIVGPSSTFKTEGMLSIGFGDIETTDKITPHTLISGRVMKEELREKVDLAAKLKNKIWVNYDFSSILSMQRADRGEIYADMRRIYDGSIKKSYGSGVRQEYKGLHCSFITGVTDAIDTHYSEMTELGSRHILFRTKEGDRMEVMRRMKDTWKTIKKGRVECRKAAEKAVTSIKNIEDMSDRGIEETMRIVDLTSRMKTPVSLERGADAVAQSTNPEGVGRLFGMFIKLGTAAKAIMGEKKAIELLKRVAKDSAKKNRSLIYNLLEMECSLSATAISQELDLGERTIRRELAQMRHLHLISCHSGLSEDKYRDDAVYYQLADK